MHPLPSQEPPSIDLRKAINAAQIYCAKVPDSILIPNNYPLPSEDQLSDWAFPVASDRAHEAIEAQDDLRLLSQFMEHVSVANAHLNRKLDRSLDVSVLFPKAGILEAGMDAHSFPLSFVRHLPWIDTKKLQMTK